jgi:hypothetical protein
MPPAGPATMTANAPPTELATTPAGSPMNPVRQALGTLDHASQDYVNHARMVT